jgi:putative DNA-invertase from lambdoid prophage Rac
MNTLVLESPLTLGYVRVSTDRQELSIDAQTAAVQRAANYRFGEGTEVELFAEPDTSGSIPFAEREQGKALLLRCSAAASQGRPITVIVPKLDRFGRDTVDVSTTVKLLESMGATLHFLDLNVDTRTPAGKFFMHICAAFAEMELSRIRERIQTALDHKRGAGLLTGTVPYGWNAIETGETTTKGTRVRRLEPNPEEQKWILHMAALRTAGWSYNAIAIDLNLKGVPTKRGAGETMTLRDGKHGAAKKLTTGQWQFGQVAKILNSRTVQDWLHQPAQQAA